jgi:hypothetical protein
VLRPEHRGLINLFGVMFGENHRTEPREISQEGDVVLDNGTA